MSGRRHSTDRERQPDRTAALDRHRWLPLDDTISLARRRHDRMQSSLPTTDRHRIPTTLRLSEFDGQGYVQTHILKYRYAKRYYNWSDDEGVAHLKQSLVGDASCILWNISDNCTEQALIEMLQLRFGNQRQADNLKFQFKVRKQGKNETIDQYFSAILKLSQLALYPSQDSEILQSSICDQFVEGLFDVSLRIKVLEANHKSIYDACEHALRLETISESVGLDRRYARTVPANSQPEPTSSALAKNRI